MGRAARKGRARRATKKRVVKHRINSATWTGAPVKKRGMPRVVAHSPHDEGAERMRHYGRLGLRYGLLAFVVACAVAGIAAAVS